MITRPTLIIDEVKAQSNIEKVIEKCNRHKLSFRPHFKTHQSATVASWYRKLGVQKITVSSVVMAAYFVEHGWEDILIAFPYNPLESSDIEKLAKRATVGILIESEEALAHASAHIEPTVNYHLAIDCGYHRTGISWKNDSLVKQLMNYPTHHQFSGIVTHAGHTYQARSQKEIIEIHESAISNLSSLIESIDEKVYVSYGDTPSASICENWINVDELRCGNMVYFDLTQSAIGSCSNEDISVAVACPVVAIHEDRNELIVYGGGVHFSKDRLDTDIGTIYGQGVAFTETGWQMLDGVLLKNISQEHGKVAAPSSFINSTKIGDIIGFLPVHSCMTADLLVLQETLTGNRVNKLNNK